MSPAGGASRPPGPPIVRIGGMSYYLDMRYRRLRPVLDPDTVIELDAQDAG